MLDVDDLGRTLTVGVSQIPSNENIMVQMIWRKLNLI